MLLPVCVSGHIPSRVVYYLMNIRVLPRTIYITRVSRDHIPSCNVCYMCCFYGGSLICFLNGICCAVPYLASGVVRLLHLPSADAISVRLNACPRILQVMAIKLWMAVKA